MKNVEGLMDKIKDNELKLTQTEKDEFITYAEYMDMMIPPAPLIQNMTAGLFYEACAIGYKANMYPDVEGLDPKEQYYKFADGRDDGLQKVVEFSAEGFRKWYYNRERNGQPWQVCKGGVGKNIVLIVADSDDGFFFILEGSSKFKWVETIRFYLALNRAKLPVILVNHELLMKRLMEENYQSEE